MDKEVIVIGARLAGLSAGCYAQINAFSSHIFERHTVSGGVAATWKRRDYLIDGGVHFIIGYKSGTTLPKILTNIGAAQPTLETDMAS